MSQNLRSLFAWVANRRTNPIPTIDDIEKGLQFFCVVPGPDARSKLPGYVIPDSSFRQISTLLKQYESYNKAFEWHYRPRIYTVLRLIGRLDVMDHFVSQHYKDSDLPIPPHLLPSELGDSKDPFLTFQHCCLTSAIDLERGVEGKHVHFGGNGDEHFYSRTYLGSGGYG